MLQTDKIISYISQRTVTTDNRQSRQSYYGFTQNVLQMTDAVNVRPR